MHDHVDAQSEDDDQITAVRVEGKSHVDLLEMKYGDTWGAVYESTVVEPATPWVFQPTYVKLGSAAVVKSGYKSDHAIQAAGTSGYNDPTSYNKLYQTFKICKASRFQLSWSMLLPKDSVKYTAPGKPGLYVEAKAPDGLWYQMGSFSFDTKTFSSTIFTPSFKGTHKVDQWANFVADFPNSQTGTWTISMEWYVMGPGSKGTKTSTLKFKMDNFVVKPK
ncbi:hypothetical protein FOCG_03739 [Fusarium oxysporum f. sp. radicis-lycopersici 26381]|nr:hypothetical protein FOCG_03739 [Fusarium oxysporum f. sp. radicis-lycopersici 26381]